MIMPEGLTRAIWANFYMPRGIDACGTENNVQSERMTVMCRRNGELALA